jgi:hypothetical protein
MWRKQACFNLLKNKPIFWKSLASFTEIKVYPSYYPRELILYVCHVLLMWGFQIFENIKSLAIEK